MTFAETLKKIRIEKRMTMQDVGDRLGCTGALIQQYESGKRNPKHETIKRIAEALEVSELELQGNEIKNRGEIETIVNGLHHMSDFQRERALVILQHAFPEAFGNWHKEVSCADK